MSKIGLSVSMIGGILFFILTYIFNRHFYLLWLYGMRGLLGYLFFIFPYCGAIVGALLGFIDNIWQIGKNWKIESLKVGRILCCLVGFIFSLFYFLVLFPNVSHHTIPMLILFIGGITSIIEWRLERREN